ncbi:MAG: 50S ribosomal protein L29 [bacterium]|jgi:large subunit ribosomal protein L29
MKPNELRELGAAELDQRIREKAKELADMRLKHKSGTAIEKPVRMRTMRREVARMKTVQNERRAK